MALAMGLQEVSETVDKDPVLYTNVAGINLVCKYIHLVRDCVLVNISTYLKFTSAEAMSRGGS